MTDEQKEQLAFIERELERKYELFRHKVSVRDSSTYKEEKDIETLTMKANAILGISPTSEEIAEMQRTADYKKKLRCELDEISESGNEEL